MKRRDLLQGLGIISTHALFPGILAGFATGCTPVQEEMGTFLFFTEKEMNTLKEIIDIIIPATKTSSASEVNTHLFIDEVFAKCLDADHQQVIKEGMATIISSFSSSEDHEQLLIDLDQLAFQGDENAAWFKTIKQYTLIGFFTSQEGETKASNYVPSPGDYKPDIPLDENTLNYGKTRLKFYL